MEEKGNKGKRGDTDKLDNLKWTILTNDWFNKEELIISTNNELSSIGCNHEKEDSPRCLATDRESKRTNHAR